MNPSEQTLSDLILGRLPENESQNVLRQLTIEGDTTISAETLMTCLKIMKQTGIDFPFHRPETERFMDCCGTGGSGQSFFNTSTAVAFILASGGLPIVKFGNRAMSQHSRSGSFDFLGALGLTEETNLQNLSGNLAQHQLAFLYAPQCYPQLGKLSQLRRRVGVKTIFNFMGPLLNPTLPPYRIIGVSHARMQDLLAEILQDPPTIPYLKKVWLVRSKRNNLDEIDASGPTQVVSIEATGNGKRTCEPFILNPKSLPGHSGLTPVGIEPSLQKPSAEENARTFEALISNQFSERSRSKDLRLQAIRHLLCLNAGAGFFVSGRRPSFEEGVHYALQLLNNGSVQKKLQTLRAHSSV